MSISMITCNTYISMPHSCSPVRSIESLGSRCSCHWCSPWSECHTYLCQSQIQSRHLCSWKTHNLHTTVQRSRISKIVSCFWKKSVMLNTVSGMGRRPRRSHSFDLYLCSYKLAIVSTCNPSISACFQRSLRAKVPDDDACSCGSGCAEGAKLCKKLFLGVEERVCEDRSQTGSILYTGEVKGQEFGLCQSLKNTSTWKESCRRLLGMSIASKRDHGHQDSLCSDGLKVRLGQESHTHAISGLRENNGIFSQMHGPWFKPIAVHTNWNVKFHCFLLTETKA